MQISFKTKVFDFFRQVFMVPLLEKILLKFTIDKPMESMVIKFIPNNYQYPKETFRYANRNGINYKLDLYDYVDWWLYFGIKEESRTKLEKLINSTDTIIDVGTNMGSTLMNFANLTTLSGEVHGFEPDSVNYKRCCENIKLNNFKNITLNNIGLGDKAGKFTMIINTPSNRGENRISATSINNNKETIEVITLDKYVSEKKLNKVNLIKIDVEGFELNVLKGAINVLKQFKPLLFIELDDNNLKEQGYSASDLINYLLQLKYKIINAESNENINEKSNFINCHYDIICTTSL